MAGSQESRGEGVAGLRTARPRHWSVGRPTVSAKRDQRDSRKYRQNTIVSHTEIVSGAMAKMEAEADRGVVAILQRLTKMPNSAPTQHKGRATFLFIDDAQP